MMQPDEPETGDADQTSARNGLTGEGPSQQDQVVGVAWDADGGGNPFVLTGTVTLATALGGSYTMFVVMGVQFDITAMTTGSMSARFAYQGVQNAEFLKAVLQPGVTALFTA